MDNLTNTRSWKVLCWNVRGLNSEKKWEKDMRLTSSVLENSAREALMLLNSSLQWGLLEELLPFGNLICLMGISFLAMNMVSQ